MHSLVKNHIRKKSEMASESVLKKADAFFKEAKEKETSIWGFFGDSSKEEAIELYVKAGNQYKLAKSYSQAGDSYVNAAKLAEKMKGNGGEASQHWNEAGHCFKKVPQMEEAIECFDKAISYHVDNNQFSQSAKLYAELAEMFVQEHNEEQAIHYYFQAADSWSNSNSNTQAMSCNLKAADLLASAKQFVKAIAIYEKSAYASMNDLGKWSVKDYFFKAILCILANDEEQYVNPLEKAKTAFGKYCNDFPQFETSRECKFCEQLLQVIEEDDDFEDRFAQIFTDYEKISKFSTWHANILAQVKKRILKDAGNNNIDIL